MVRCYKVTSMLENQQRCLQVVAYMEFTSSTVGGYLFLRLLLMLINTVFQSRAFLVSVTKKKKKEYFFLDNPSN